MNLKSKKYRFLLLPALLSVAVFCLPRAHAAKDNRTDWNKKKWGPIVPHTKFPKDCSLCHVANRWDQMRKDFHFDHLKETGYALEGSHASAACLRCHNDRGDVKAYASRGCAGCHGDPHKSSLGPDCRRCHNLLSWQPTGILATHARTGFPLTGRHAATLCEQCHKSAAAGDFKGTSRLCNGCHMTEFQSAPNHTAMRFATTCQDCHNTNAWTGARFNHNALGANPNCYSCHAPDYLRGPNHVAQNYSKSCQGCHNTTNWQSVARFDHSTLGANPNCVSCHQPNYQAAPNHVAKNYPQTCASCHNTSNWSGATFNHAALGANPACMTCHQANYQAAPNHVARNYPQTCASCHNTSNWSGATFNHAALGANPVCFTCHQANYQSAPNHVAQNFSTSCQSCHNTTSWAANFTHTFPQNHGNANSCSSCHQGPGNATNYTCLTCHGQTQMDSKHRGRSGYSYSSPVCLGCHPRGRN